MAIYLGYIKCWKSEILHLHNTNSNIAFPNDNINKTTLENKITPDIDMQLKIQPFTTWTSFYNIAAETSKTRINMKKIRRNIALSIQNQNQTNATII